ncbi:MAG: hypothetical protein NVSMB17_15600 [Candidatus Dormibacteria bacterium]
MARVLALGIEEAVPGAVRAEHGAIITAGIVAGVHLTPRLQAVLDLVPAAASSAADIGSGHGRLAAAMAGRGLRVIATERTAASFGLLEADLARAAAPVEGRHGDGFLALVPGEVDVAVIAGLGGRGILRILDAAPWLPRWLVLQPMQDAHLLGEWLDHRGWPRTEARMAQGGRWYVGWRVEVPAARSWVA